MAKKGNRLEGGIGLFAKRNRSEMPGPQTSDKPLRFLGYGLPRGEDDNEARLVNGEGYLIQDEPLGSPVSFLDYDGVILFAGAFEGIHRTVYNNEIICKAPADLDHREREFFTATKQSIPFIFLVPGIYETYHHDPADKFDLFRRIIRKLDVYWQRRREPNPAIESRVPEFRDYVESYGTAYVCFGYNENKQDWITSFCGDRDGHYGIIVGRKVFMLPCTELDSVDKVHAACLAAVDAVIRYRRRLSKDLPEWALSFTFGSETDLLAKADDKRRELAALDAQIEGYASHKGVLAYQSDPLVEAVRRIFDHFLGIKLTVDDKYVEDATLRADDRIEAVFEIKGVKGDFKRNNINQMDSHRERLGLSAETPGLLIMNTFMEATSLKEKDQAPHPDIIKKATADHVLMMRTLDLLRFADLVERGVIKKDEMRRLILGEVGWLKVEEGEYAVVKA
jgi:hypothetical protein